MQGCESVCEEKVWNAWKDVLFNALKVWKWGFVKSKKIWTFTSMFNVNMMESYNQLVMTYQLQAFAK